MPKTKSKFIDDECERGSDDNSDDDDDEYEENDEDRAFIDDSEIEPPRRRKRTRLTDSDLELDPDDYDLVREHKASNRKRVVQQESSSEEEEAEDEDSEDDEDSDDSVDKPAPPVAVEKPVEEPVEPEKPVVLQPAIDIFVPPPRKTGKYNPFDWDRPLVALKPPEKKPRHKGSWNFLDGYVKGSNDKKESKTSGKNKP